MKLIIVESPTKCETIKKYVGSDYNVVASYGHIRDLSTTGKGGLGVNIEDDFKPTYVVSKDKIKVVSNLKKQAKQADDIYLATDPDREGEAISWHLADVLNLDINTTKRLEFHEITKTAIKHALENPRTIDMDLVTSQETRRIIDRIMGFKLSTLMKRKIGSVSAGRVQSVTLKLITEREKEVQEFVPEEYWMIEAVFNKKYKATLETYKNEKINLKNEQDADNVLNNLSSEFKVININKNKRFTDSQIPFRTSVLQQVAYNSCKFSTKVTQSYAQKLFEIGLITYIRTDGTGLAKEFIEHGKKYIQEKYGEEYLASSQKLKSLENKDNSSMAHEAIRPTSLENTPDKVKEEYQLERGPLALYKLIYNRSIAALMAPKEDEVTNVRLFNNDYIFSLVGTKNIFKGYSKVYTAEEDIEEKTLVGFNLDDILKADNVEKSQHFTKGPSRFNEAKVVKTMEEDGIGRPSTYASTIATLYARDYVKNEKGSLIPTEQGIITVNNLNKFFEPFMETNYTAQMESELDEVCYKDGSRNLVLHQFYDEFEKLFVNACENMEKEQPKLTGNICPKCGKPLVLRKSKFGTFEACSGYPDCNYVKKEEKKELVYSSKTCPKCGKPLVLRKSKKGEFYACSGFPECKYIEGQEEKQDEVTDLVCPKCGKPLLRKSGKHGKNDFYACSGFPKCRYIQAIKEEK